jgi:DNA invertase Pin-like site-specific DNA recombinase
LARNLDDLRRIVQDLTRRGVRIEFVKEGLTFTGEDSPMANLMLSVMGALAEFERSLLRECQREGIAVAKRRGAYRGRKRSLNPPLRSMDAPGPEDLQPGRNLMTQGRREMHPALWYCSTSDRFEMVRPTWAQWIDEGKV